MRWIFRIIAALALVAVVIVGMVFLLPVDKIGQIASDQLERATGRKLTLSGQFSPTLYPVLGVKTGPITISNAPWATDPTMVQADGVAVGVKLSALLGGDLEISKLQLIRPVIHLEKTADGRANWEFSEPAGAASAPTGAGPAQQISLASGALQGGRLIYRDAQSGQNIDLSDINITLSLPKGTDQANLAGDLRYQGKPLEIDTTLAGLSRLLGGGNAELTAKGDFGGLGVGYQGRIGGIGQPIPMLDGRLTLNAADSTPLVSLAGPLPEPVKTLQNLSVNGLVQLSQAGVSFDGETALVLNGLPVKLMLEASGTDDWADTLGFDLGAQLTAGEALNLRFDGQVSGRSLAAKGLLDLKSGDFRALMQALAIPLDAPKGTFKTLAAKGKLRASPKKITLTKSSLTLDDNALAGDVSVTLAGKPYVAAKLSAPALDLSPYVAQDQAGSGGGEATVGWSKAPLRIVGLEALDADLSLVAQKLDLGVAKLGLTRIKLNLAKGLLTAKLIDVRAFKGAMSGLLHLRGGGTLAFDADVLAKDMQLEPLLSDLLGIDRLSGSGTTKMQLAGRGGSLFDVMNSLSGKGTINFNHGTIRGVDLAAMMRNLKSAFGGFEGATEFSKMTGSFTLNKGVLENVDLSLVSPLFKAAGKGKVGIGGRFMDYVVTPSTLNGDAKISVPVFITGSWDNLKFRPDLENLIDLVLEGKLKDNAEVQKARAKLKKARAKLRDPKKTAAEELRKKVAKELNSQATDEKTLKHKAEDKIKEELGNALFKLLK